MIRVMLDVETMATSPIAAVVAIGCAVLEDGLSSSPILTTKSIRINPDLAIGDQDQKTLDWWGTQNPAVRLNVFGGKLTPALACQELNDFLKLTVGTKTALYYAAPAAFDFPILRMLYSSVRIEPFWDWYNERCSRTLFKTLAEDVQVNLFKSHPTQAHEPVADCIAQLKDLMEVFKVLAVPHNG